MQRRVGSKRRKHSNRRTQLAHRTEGFRKVFDHLDRTQPVSTIPTGRSNTSSFDAGDQFGLTPTICRGEHALIKRNRKFVDSPLEGTGFELLVPRREARDFRSIPEQLCADDLNRSRR